MSGKRRGEKKRSFELFRNVNFEQPTLHTGRRNEEHLAEATEGVPSATLATLLIITLALSWKHNSLATRSITAPQETTKVVR